MERTPAEIATYLDHLADDLEAEARDYRMTAKRMRLRYVNGFAPSAGEPSKPVSSSPGSPGDSQRKLLAAYEARPTEGLTVHQVIAYCEQHGTPVSLQAARATNNRLLKNGKIVKDGYGLYRLAKSLDEPQVDANISHDPQPGDALPRPLGGQDFSAHRFDGSPGANS